MYHHDPRTFCDVCHQTIPDEDTRATHGDLQCHLVCLGELMYRLKKGLSPFLDRKRNADP